MKSLYGIIIWFFESLPNVFEGQFVFVFFEAMYFEDVCVCVCLYTCVYLCHWKFIYLFACVVFKGFGTRVCGIHGVCVFEGLGSWSLVTIGRMKGGMVYLHLKVDLIILRGLIDNVNLSLRSYGLRERERERDEWMFFWKDSFFKAYETCCYMEGPLKKWMQKESCIRKQSFWITLGFPWELSLLIRFKSFGKKKKKKL